MKKRIDKDNNRLQKSKVIKEKPKKKKRYLLKTIALVIIFSFSLLYYMRFIETNRLSVKEIKVESGKISDTLSGLKIVHISDLHYKTTIDKSYLKKLTREINKLKPDILVFTGDLLSDEIEYSGDDYKDLIYYFSKMESNSKYYVRGNLDYKDNDVTNILESANFISLNNKEDYIYGSDNSKIIIHGLGSFLENDFDSSSAFITNDDTLFNIALFHEPDNILELRDKSIDLALAGHSLNNRVNLPTVKDMLSIDGAIDYYDDYYNLNKMHLYVNAGIGTNKNRLRLFTPPTVNFYRIVRK